MSNVSTGFYARPEDRTGRAKVHVALDGRPACGTSTKGRFQWCAAGVHLGYVDCERCREWHRRREIKK